MSKLVELIELYQSENKRLNLGLTKKLIEKVARGLGPSIYKADSNTVSGSDKKELATVKKSYLLKKLGLEDGPKLDDAIAGVMDKMGKGNRKKYRDLVYALLCTKFKKESVDG